MWKITAGRANAFVRQFFEQNLVAIGWREAGNYTGLKSRDDLLELFMETWPLNKTQSNRVGANQVWRFLHEVKIGDEVLTYDPNERVYHYGKVTGDPAYSPDANEILPVIRQVDWTGLVSRDDLTKPTRNTLGATMTIFRLSETAAAEVRALNAGQLLRPELATKADDESSLEAVDPFDGIADQALERIKDRIRGLEWDDMQELVAALLRALGYRTIVSPAGSDRGKDIIASKDGFGFERPRIVVEVKHRKEAMKSQEIRSFLGGRHADDRGLYVSTGGFTKDAHYEAERASTVTHLMSLDGLARALIEQYERLDEKGRTLLPLTKLYWPL